MNENELVEIYDSMIQEKKEKTLLEADFFESKPIVYDEILSPKDKIQNDYMGNIFVVDSEGAHDIIQIFQNFAKEYPEHIYSSFGLTLYFVYNVTNSYFAGKSPDNRVRMYKFNKDTEEHIGVLSDFKGKGVAECSEKAAAVHVLLSVLAKAR